MKRILITILMLLTASPAFAEVCDKERPRWDPKSGSVNPFEELYFFFTSPVGIGLIIMIVATLYFRKRWLSIISAALILLIAAITAANWFWLGDDILNAAYREGCRASPLVTIGVLALLSIWLFQYGKPPVTQRLNTVDLGDDLDDVEMLEAIEKIFGIEIKDREAEKLITMGDLYELVNEKLKPESDFDPIWSLVCQIVREYSGSRDPVDKDTTFFPKFAKEREEVANPSAAPKDRA